MAKTSKKKDDETKPLDNKNREMFCRLYAGNHYGSCFGNAVRSHLAAFGGDERIDKNNDLLTIENRKRDIAWKKRDMDAHAAAKKRIDELEDDSRKAYASAGNEGPRLLRNAQIMARVNYLFDQYLEPAAMDREMAKVIAQDKDPMSKVAAYREVAKVRGRINEKLSGEVTFRWEDDSQDDGPAKQKKTGGKKKTKKVVAEVGIQWGGEEE